MNGSPVPRGPRTARDRSERRILGVLLLQPELWTQVQKVVAVTDFAEGLRRRLAEVYWTYQRDEGVPVFNEFLGVLGDPALQELAVEVLDEVESLSAVPDLKAILTDAVGYLSEQRKAFEQQKLVAEVRRTSEEPLSDQDEEALLRQIEDKARRPDLRRA
jgi:hypothetical protein